MGHNKRCDICIIDVPLSKEKECATKVMFKGIMAENFPGLAKNMILQIQDADHLSSRADPKDFMLRHIIISLEHSRQTNFKKQQERNGILLTGDNNSNDHRFSIRIPEGQKEVNTFKVPHAKNYKL